MAARGAPKQNQAEELCAPITQNIVRPEEVRCFCFERQAILNGKGKVAAWKPCTTYLEWKKDNGVAHEMCPTNSSRANVKHLAECKVGLCIANSRASFDR